MGNKPAYGYWGARDNQRMDQEQIRALLEQVRRGEVDTDAAMGRLKHMPFEDLGYAKVDHHRALRHGMPEVIFAKGKTPEQVAGIAAPRNRVHGVLIDVSGGASRDLRRASVPKLFRLPLIGPSPSVPLGVRFVPVEYMQRVLEDHDRGVAECRTAAG